MYACGNGWECGELQPGAGRPAGRPLTVASVALGCVCEGATGDEPTVGRAIADTSRRDFKRGVRRLPLVCSVAGGHIDKLCTERVLKIKFC